MSAPKEVFIAMKRLSPRIDGWGLYDSPCDGSVRYLRADLTCEDCEWWREMNECGDNPSCPRTYDISHISSDPACMAIKLEEGKA